MLLSALACMGAQAATITVNDATDGSAPSACTLRDAVAAINSGMDVNGCMGAGYGYGTDDTIEFDASLAGGTIHVNVSGGIQINQSLVINGPTGRADGITLDGNDSNRIFDAGYLFSGRLSINGVSLIRGNAGSGYAGGAIYAPSSGITIAISNSIFSANSAGPDGGAIYASGAAAITIVNSTFSGNSANSGGGGAIYAPSSGITIVNSTFNDNSTTFG